MSSFINMLLGQGGDPLDHYLQSIGVGPINSPTAPPPTPQASALPTLPAAPAPVAVPPPGVPVDQDVAVEGDAWKPHHRTTLGTVADLMLGMPIFANKAKRDNMKEAFQGFDEKPLRTIRRVAKFNPDAAWKMYNVYHDNNAVDEQQKTAKDNTTFGRGIGLLASANDQNYSTVKQRVEQYWASQKFDPGIKLPDSYDPDAIQGIREAGMKPNEQLNYENNANYHEQRLKQFQADVLSKIQTREADDNRAERSLQARQSHEQAQLGLEGMRTSNAIRHDMVMENIAERQHPNQKVVKTPNGLMELSPSGITGRIGDQIWQKVDTGQWKRVK